MRFRRRSFGLQLTILFLTGVVVLARYWYNVGFDQKYRKLLADELARYGLGAEIGRMTLDPVQGLIARDVELFDLEEPELRLAGVNRITLDIDLARLVNKEDFLRSVTLTRANLSLPVDPADPESEWIRVRDLSARLVIRGRRIEIASAEADLAGIHITLRGEVLRPLETLPPDPEEAKRRRDQQLREMRDRRGALRTVLRVLDRFKVPDGPDGLPRTASMARVELDVRGDLADLDSASVRATLQGGPVRCGNFLAEEYSADAVLENGELTLRRLSVQDAGGVFTATASWKIRQSESVDFAVDSGIDLLSLVHGMSPGLVIPDDVTVTATPRFRASGVLHTGRPFTLERPPLDVTGSITSGPFQYKSTPYESLHGDFALRHEDGFIYLRNLAVKHATGSLTGQFMRRADGMRYEFHLDSGMEALTPLLELPALQKPLQPVSWSDQSRVMASFTGTGSLDGKTWNHRGTADARDYRLRDSLVRQFQGGIEVGPGRFPVITVRDFLLRREDGDISGKLAVVDQPAALLHLTGIASSCMPSPAAGMFAPRTGEVLARYFFESPPRTELEGTVGLKSPEFNDLKVRLNAPGLCGLPVAKQDWRFTGVSGTLHLKKDTITVDLSGRTQARGRFTPAVRFDAPAEARVAGVFGLTKDNWISATRYMVNVDAPRDMQLLLGEREFPVQQLNATVRNDAGKLAVIAGGSLFDGRLAATLDFPDQARGGHSASVTLDRVNFSRLTALFGSKDETGGVISGRFTYETPDGAGPTIEGSGVASLQEANIFALPLLGPLSTIISALLPGDRIAYSVARQAEASFTVSRGRVALHGFEAATRTFRLTADGSVDAVRDSVDIDARINLRGAPGMLLYPVSKLLEYHAGGTISDPGWRPKIMPKLRRRNGAREEEGP
jgi:hypothetical protein